MTQLIVVTAGLSQPSSTRMLADRLARSTASRLESAGSSADVKTIELRGLAHALADRLLTGFPSGDLATALEQVRDADALVAVTPIFAASYSGLFKAFFDVVEPGTLAGKPVLIAATAGTARHSLALDHALRPLFSHLRALVVPTAVFAATEDFGQGTQADGRLQERVDRAGAELADLVLARRDPGTAAVEAGGIADATQISAAGIAFTPFEQLLGRSTARVDAA